MAIDAGESHVLALEEGGAVRAWGRNDGGQSSVPIDLEPCAGIGAGTLHSCVVQQDGTVRAWGRNDYGALDIPANLAACTKIAAGEYHSAVILHDGSVRAWGLNTAGQADVPADLGVCTEISASNQRTVALRLDGTVRVWGDCTQGRCDVPVDLGACAAIRSGLFHTVVVRDTDCDADGVRDSLELFGHDCNGNRFHDACDAAVDVLEDCNANGLGDSCEKELTIGIPSGQLSPIGYASPRTWTVPSVVRALSPVTLQISASGDFGGLQEFLRVRIGAGFDEQALRQSFDCNIGGTAQQSFTLSAEEFNAAIGADGALRVVMEPSIAVDANGCNGGTWVEASLSYIGARPADCNANGLLDGCEIAAGYSPDANGNGVIDACENPLLPCPADFNQDASVDGADLGALLSAWGASGQTGVDLNSDGSIDGADLGVLLSAWGPCAR